jgi:xanthine dehydrogenase YagR molybdenum-binding subunit
MEVAKTKVIGEAISRIDGVLKVTGAANYATDWPIRNIAHAYLIKGTIAAGSIS